MLDVFTPTRVARHGALAFAVVFLLALAPAGASAQSSTDPSTGANVPLTYFGPQPSSVDKELVGPVQLLRAGKLDRKAMTIRLPLYLGHMRNGRNVWYILTDTTDKAVADALGLNHSGKLVFADVGRAVRTATLERDTGLTFDQGTVDFRPGRTLVAGSAPGHPFPPAVASPGSVGDADYTPLVKIRNAGNHIYNAPIVAFDKSADEIRACRGNANHGLVHDRVVKICPGANGGGTVTLRITPIFSFAKPADYISMEASDATVATLDKGTFAPALGDIQGGRDDSAFSAIERLFVTINGPTGAHNPQRQGLNSALVDHLPPLQVIGGIPTVALDYSPIWDINLGQWTPTAVRLGYRSRLIDEFQILDMVKRGFITGPNGARYGSVGINVNCPIIDRAL